MLTRSLRRKPAPAPASPQKRKYQRVKKYSKPESESESEPELESESEKESKAESESEKESKAESESESESEEENVGEEGKDTPPQPQPQKLIASVGLRCNVQHHFVLRFELFADNLRINCQWAQQQQRSCTVALDAIHTLWSTAADLVAPMEIDGGSEAEVTRVFESILPSSADSFVEITQVSRELVTWLVGPSDVRQQLLPRYTFDVQGQLSGPLIPLPRCRETRVCVAWDGTTPHTTLDQLHTAHAARIAPVASSTWIRTLMHAKSHGLVAPLRSNPHKSTKLVDTTTKLLRHHKKKRKRGSDNDNSSSDSD